MGAHRDQNIPLIYIYIYIEREREREREEVTIDSLRTLASLTIINVTIFMDELLALIGPVACKT